MPDRVSPEVRSRIMSAIRGKDTRPELVLRKGLHAKGFRFRLHTPKLPGKPDLVFPRYSAVIFVNGCFWHGHETCASFRLPTTRPDFWRDKIAANRSRDLKSASALSERGWRVATVWECAFRSRKDHDISEVIDRCAEWLRSDARCMEFSSLYSKPRIIPVS